MENFYRQIIEDKFRLKVLNPGEKDRNRVCPAKPEARFLGRRQNAVLESKPLSATRVLRRELVY